MSEEMYQFLGRVKTFALGVWLYQTPQLSPYILASRGFRYLTPQTIECHICKFQVSFENLKVDEDNHSQEIKILGQLKDHNKDCIYSGVTTPDSDLYTLKREELYANIENIFSKVKDTYVFYKGGLPRVADSFWSKYVAKYETVFSKNNPKFYNGKEIDLALLLSVFGWQVTKEEAPKLNCLFCGRTVSVDSYSCVSSQRLRIEEDSKEPSGNYFNPIDEHRYFCIWGHFDDFREDPIIYGWEICLKYLLDKMLDVEKGWAQRQKFQEVTQVKKQFSKIIDEFSQKINNSIIKFNDLISNSSNRVDHRFEEEDLYNKKMQETKQAVQNIRQEVDEITKPLLKELKYS